MVRILFNTWIKTLKYLIHPLFDLRKLTSNQFLIIKYKFYNLEKDIFNDLKLLIL